MTNHDTNVHLGSAPRTGAEYATRQAARADHVRKRFGTPLFLWHGEIWHRFGRTD